MKFLWLFFYRKPGQAISMPGYGCYEKIFLEISIGFIKGRYKNAFRNYEYWRNRKKG